MSEKIRIAPSILSADFLVLGDDLKSVSSADLIHYDVMDGSYVPNISFGPGILEAVKRGSDLPVDVHMMVANPDEAYKGYLDAGADILTFHMEAAKHPRRIVDEIHAAGRMAGVAINPGTAVSSLEAILECLDMVLVMSVNPGFGGQAFIDHTYSQLKAFMALCETQGVSPLIEVDGGISAANAERVVAAGANVLVAGSSVFGADDRAAEIERIRAAGERGLFARGA